MATDPIHLKLVEPEEGQEPRTRRDQRLVTLRAWIDSGPGVKTGSTPAKMLIAAQRSFAKFSGTVRSEKSDGLTPFENDLDALGYRGGNVIYQGETLWLLVLPQKKREKR